MGISPGYGVKLRDDHIIVLLATHGKRLYPWTSPFFVMIFTIRFHISDLKAFVFVLTDLSTWQIFVISCENKYIE